MENKQFNFGLKICESVFKISRIKRLFSIFQQLKQVFNAKFFAQHRIFNLSKQLLKKKIVKEFVKFSRKHSGKRSKISKLKLFVTILENMVRARLFEYFLAINDHFPIQMQNTKTQNKKMIEYKLTFDETIEKNSKNWDLDIEESPTPFFPKDTLMSSLISELAKLKKHPKTNYNSENSKHKPNTYENFIGNLMNVKGSSGNFEDLKSFDEEINVSFKDHNESYNEEPLKKVYEQKKNSIVKNIRSTNLIKFGIDPKTTIMMIKNNQPEAFFQKNDPKNIEFEEMPFEKIENMKISIDKKKSSQSFKIQALILLKQKIESIKMKINSNNHIQLEPFLDKFYKIKDLLNKKKDINQNLFDEIKKVVEKIAEILELKEFYTSAVNNDSIYHSFNEMERAFKYNDRYKKNPGSRYSRSIDSSSSQKVYQMNFQNKLKIESPKVEMIDIKICEDEGNHKLDIKYNSKIQTKAEDIKNNQIIFVNKFNKTRIKKRETVFTKEISSVIALFVGVSIVFQRKIKKNVKEFYSKLKSSFIFFKKVKISREFFQKMILKDRISFLRRLKFKQKRKIELLNDIFFLLAKNYSRLIKETIWVLKNNMDKRFFKMRSLFLGKKISLISTIESGQRYRSVSPRKKQNQDQMRFLFSKSINNKTIDEIKQIEVDSFFADLEKEYNDNFGKNLSLIKKK